MAGFKDIVDHRALAECDCPRQGIPRIYLKRTGEVRQDDDRGSICDGFAV